MLVTRSGGQALWNGCFNDGMQYHMYAGEAKVVASSVERLPGGNGSKPIVVIGGGASKHWCAVMRMEDESPFCTNDLGQLKKNFE